MELKDFIVFGTLLFFVIGGIYARYLESTDPKYTKQSDPNQNQQLL
jgi:hypothetical protein